MNRVILHGRAATDVKFRLTQNGTAVANFILAVPNGFKKKDNGEIPTDFPRIDAWGRAAESCRDFLTKGRPCLVEGHITTDTYVKDGATIKTTYVTAEHVEFLGYRKQYPDGRPMADNEKNSEEVGMPSLKLMSFHGIPDEEIPF